jgi:hypothetical protein
MAVASRLVVLTLLLCVVRPAVASHTIFSASVDRFEIDGNAFGPADGTLDQVDEFDNGTLAPEWGVLLGTAVESGGVLTVKNPGVDISLIPGVTLDISNVENSVDVANGGGNFTATSYWVPTLPSTNTGFHFQLYGVGGSDIEAAGLTVNNNDADLAAAAGTPVGYFVSQEVTFINGTGTPQQDVLSFDPVQVTGQIVLRMTFDDASDTLTCSFSLDGGTTFQSPFPPLHVFQAVDEHEILLGANSVEATGSSGGECVTITKPVLGLKKLNAGGGAQRLAFKGRLPFTPGTPAPFDPAAYGAAIVLAENGGGNALWVVTVPAGGLGTGCDPSDGWRLGGGTYSYENVSNALPPDCVSGSAQGLTALKLKDRRFAQGVISFKAKASGTTVDHPAGKVLATMVLGQEVQDGSCGSALLTCVTGSGSARCTAP